MRTPVIVVTALIGLTTGTFNAGAAQTSDASDDAARSSADSTDAPTAQDTAVAQPVLRAARFTGEIELDGVLDEAVWQSVPVATGFKQTRPDPGEPAHRRTEARVLVGGDAIYVGARMFDDPDSIAAQLSRRDQADTYSDWFFAAFDSYNDNRSAFAFGVNPVGVEVDLFISDDGNQDISWDAVWDVATQVDTLGWSAEFRIPLSQIRYSVQREVWGVNFLREIARFEEESFWAETPPDAPGLVSQFGELTGLTDLPSPTRLELEPYALGRVTRAPGDSDNPFYDTNALYGSVGLDLQYGLTPALTLTGTINPDFGQVEADPSVVNLSAFETFFPEQRPFFVEGSDIFAFDLRGGGDLFYSRRIGRRPHGGAPDDAVFQNVPGTATILGAAKVSGKTADGWSIGILDAVTAAEDATFVSPDGTIEDAHVEPLTNYGVARVIRDFRDGQSAVGGVLMATNRRLDPDGRLSFLHSAAYVGGVDGRHRFGDGHYEVVGQFVGSHIRGSEESIERIQLAPGHNFQRPDADHVEVDASRTALSGWYSSARASKIGGGHWRWQIEGMAYSPGFEANDLGFQQRVDQLMGRGYVCYEQNEPGTFARDAGVCANGFTGWTFGGENEATAGNVNGFIDFQNYWSAYGGVERGLQSLSTTALRGGPAIVNPGGTFIFGGMETDDREPVSAGVDFNAGFEDGTDGWHAGVFPGIDWRPSTRLDLSLDPGLSWRHDAWQYVGQHPANGETRYIFGNLERRTLSMTARASYAFTPELSLQFYAQPFISAGEYSGFMEVANPRADAFEDRFRAYSDGEIAYDAGANTYAVDRDRDGTADFGFDDPDFNFKQFRSNAVLRWEWRPGSTFFVVWNSELTGFRPEGSFAPRRDFERLFEADGTNVLLIKASYWFSP